MGFLFATILFWSSVLLTPILFLYAVFKSSWRVMLSSCLTILPLSLYFISGEPPVFWFGFIFLIIPLILSVVFYRKQKTKVSLTNE